MYSLLLFLHSLFRWLVVFSLLYAILRARRGLRSYKRLQSQGEEGAIGAGRSAGTEQSAGGPQAGRVFTKTDDAIRHWTATISHIQLMLGCVLYFISPVIRLFYSSDRAAMARTAAHRELTFFGVIHISLMLSAIVVITIGSALAKRRENSRDKFATMLKWFSIAGILILMAIPWPWSPLASRPLFRTF